MNKLGYWSGGKSFFSLILGLVFLAAGLALILPIYNLTLLSFVPLSLITSQTIKIALLIGGILLLIDSFTVGHPRSPSRLLTILAGLLMAVIGAIPLLVIDYKLVSIPFIATLTIPDIAMAGLLAFFGIYLIIDSFLMYPRRPAHYY